MYSHHRYNCFKLRFFTKEKTRAKVCEGRVYTFLLEFIVFIKERQSFVECESWRLCFIC